MRDKHTTSGLISWLVRVGAAGYRHPTITRLMCRSGCDAPRDRPIARWSSFGTFQFLLSWRPIVPNMDPQDLWTSRPVSFLLWCRLFFWVSSQLFQHKYLECCGQNSNPLHLKQPWHHPFKNRKFPTYLDLLSYHNQMLVFWNGVLQSWRKRWSHWRVLPKLDISEFINESLLCISSVYCLRESFKQMGHALPHVMSPFDSVRSVVDEKIWRQQIEEDSSSEDRESVLPALE